MESTRSTTRVTAELDVRLAITPDDHRGRVAAITLTPDQAANLGTELLRAAEEAVHESRSRRRAFNPPAPADDTWCPQRDASADPCQKLIGHAGFHVSPDGNVYS